MSSELVTMDDNQESIIDKFVRGMKPTDIAKEVNLPRKEVLALIRQWRETVQNDNESRDVARDALNVMVEHYDRLIKKFYDLADDIREQMNINGSTPQWTKELRGVLDSIAGLEAKRVDQLQKAGLYDNNQMGDELAQMEKEKDIIIDILKNDLCNRCRPGVMQKIGEMTGRVEVVVVQSE